MGTAVLQPHDCLSPSQGRRTRYTVFNRTAAPRLDKKPSSYLQYRASGLVAESTRRRSLRDVHERNDTGYSLNAGWDKGLLPLPDHLVHRAFSSLHRIPSKWRVGEIMELITSNQFDMFDHQKSWIPYHKCVVASDELASRTSVPGSKNAALARLSTASSVHNRHLSGAAREKLTHHETNSTSKSHLLSVKGSMLQSKRLGASSKSYYRKKKEHPSAYGCCIVDKPILTQVSRDKRPGYKYQLRRTASENVPSPGLRNPSLEKVSITNVQEAPLELNSAMKGGMKNGDSEYVARTSSALAYPVEKCMSLSSMESEKWAGPSFFNSPSPSSLPVPSFTMKRTRMLSASAMSSTAVQVFSNVVIEAKQSWDVTFATEYLRGLLHLDHTC